MADKSRISLSPKVFDPYIKSTDKHLQDIEPVSNLPYWQWLGLTSVNAGDWHNKRQFWDTSNTGLFALYSNPATCTSIVKQNVKKFIADFKTFANPLLDIISANPNAGTEEEKIFNLILKKNRKKPSKTHTPIAEQCNSTFKSSNGGDMKAASRSAHDAKRASVTAGADGVQYAYLILDFKPEAQAAAVAAAQKANDAARTTNPANPVLIAIPALPPQHPDDSTKQEFHSGATHLLHLGAVNSGKYLYVWSRWYNSKHPELAGGWSERQVILIG